MSNLLKVTVRFLDPQPRFHGRGDDSEPEWPPSPMRLFQSLVAAATARWHEKTFDDYARPALQWLEAISPEMVAPTVSPDRFGYRMYVPNNSGDLMTAAWARGDTETSMAKFRVEKDVRPTLLHGDAIHYLYPFSTQDCPHLETLRSAARSMTHLGWGIDMVATDVTIINENEVSKLEGERWRASANHIGTPLRVPTPGTLDALMEKHLRFLNRLSQGEFKPVPPLTQFQIHHYCRATDTEVRQWCAFSILHPDASGNRAFDTPTRAVHVAAWVRHATAELCADWPDLATFVHGHEPNNGKKQAKGPHADRRFQYLPLPSIERRPDGNVTGAIRRVMIAAPAGCQDRIDFIRRRLAGQELIWNDSPVGILNMLPTSDWVLKQYTGTSQVWTSVIPVILPGYDDHDSRKAERLLKKTLVDSGVPIELVEQLKDDDLQWRHVGFRAGLDLVKNYVRPDHLTGSMFHVRIRFAQPVRGPLVVGAGRYRGFGLFAIDE